MKMKKFLALLLAGTLAFSISVITSAAEEVSSSSSSSSSSSVSSNSTSSKTKKSAAQIQAETEAKALREAEAEAAAESRANALAAEAAGLPMATISAAAEAGKSVGEFINNAVTEVAGLESVTPIAQGGGVIIDGTPSNQSFSITKPVSAQVDSAKAQAAALNGTVMNVVDVKGAVSFETASVNFYMPGVTGTENIQVYQLANGQWNAVAVAEVRADHVVVDMTKYGVLAFIQVQ